MPPSISNNAPEGEDIKTLSPFVVAVSPNDIGYYAENTLAGSRLNTSLADLAASITVVTRQQMLDTAAIDMNDVFLYEANTEGTGNYTSFSYDSGGVIDNTALQPQTANRVRGIGSVDRARNFYASINTLPFDIYNTESVEINRGPNSLLFGLGSASGIVNQTTSSAQLNRRFAETSLRYGSENGYRASFRINQPVLPKRFALFAAGLYNSSGFTRQPSYDISRRAYLAAMAAPTRTTTIRASYERYNGDRRPPNTVTPRDGITEWRNAGSPSWDPVTSTVTVRGASRAIANLNFANVDGLVAFGSVPTLYYENGPKLYLQLRTSTVGPLGAYNNTFGMVASVTQIEKQQTTLPLYIVSGITDRSLYDWTKVNVISGNVDRGDADIYNVEIDQKLAANLFLQGGWYREQYHRYRFAYNASSTIAIDPNTRLVDGSINPYFGKPYFQYSNAADQNSEMRNDNLRLSAAYVVDFRRRPGSW